MDRWELVNEKIKRAKKHIADLKIAVEGFLEQKPYSYAADDDPQTGDWVVTVQIREPVPAEICLVAGDAVHNLRSALDHLVFSIAQPRIEEHKRQLSFPIVSDPGKLDGELIRLESTMSKIGSPSQDLIRLIRETKPYRGGNHGLWGLSELDNRDKHRLLLAGCANANQFATGIQTHFEIDARVLMTSLSMGVPLKNGDEIWRLPREHRSANEAYKDFEFTFGVAFREPGRFEGQTIYPSLVNLTNLVERTIEPFRPLL